MDINYTAWNKFSEGKTPGTTPLPVKLVNYISPSAEKVIVDLGCGWGRVSTWLYLQGYSVIGTDINPNEIAQAKQDLKKLPIRKNSNTINFQTDDVSSHITLPDSCADAVTVNGVLLAMTTPSSRHGLMSEIFRILKPNGILYLAEFAQTTTVEYPADYRKHALITGEYGTVVAFKPQLHISFKGKSDPEVIALGKPENIDYFSHHYSESEIKALLSQFTLLEFTKDEFVTRSGKKINGFVIYARKHH
jgi:ubiquinone/menaquinone biosynthesis C-methylase UbiE